MKLWKIASVTCHYRVYPNLMSDSPPEFCQVRVIKYINLQNKEKIIDFILTLKRKDAYVEWKNCRLYPS